jgi:hypothetical protein
MVYRDPKNPKDTQFFSDDEVFGKECPGDRKVKIQPLPVDRDTIYLALFICE